jgi:Type II CAAX prenyl endopeptidase Rce1-like
MNTAIDGNAVPQADLQPELQQRSRTSVFICLLTQLLICAGFVLCTFSAEKIVVGAAHAATYKQQACIKLIELLLCISLIKVAERYLIPLRQTYLPTAPRVFYLLISICIAFNLLPFFFLQSAPTDTSSIAYLLYFSASTFCIGAAEELSFRHLAYQNLMRVSAAVYLLVNSLSFAALHAISGGLQGALIAWLGGVSLDLARLGGMRLSWLIILHALVDLSSALPRLLWPTAEFPTFQISYWTVGLLLAPYVGPFIWILAWPKNWRPSPLAPRPSPLAPRP